MTTQEIWKGRMYNDLAMFTQSNNIPLELRLDLERKITSIVEFALSQRAKEESKTAKRIRRFFRDLFKKEEKTTQVSIEKY